LLDASSGKPLPGFDRLEGGELAPVGDHLLLQHGRVLDSRTAKTVWTIPADLVGGGDGIVAAVTYLDRRHITAYRASASEGIVVAVLRGCGSTSSRTTTNHCTPWDPPLSWTARFGSTTDSGR
jgi:hypothetical protein